MASSDRPAGRYHPGELAVQERAGVRHLAARIARGIHATIPAAAAEFVARQRFVALSAADPARRAWVTVLRSDAGFARAIDARRVALDAAPPRDDPLAGGLMAGAHVGLLFIDLATRRRMRLNGTVESAPDGGLVVIADQVYSNCPKYMQRRKPVGAPSGPPPPAETARRLDERQRRWIARADTFFIGTVDSLGGWDASHRGGRPGFVAAPEPSRVTWPDYAGNTMFNTLGNIVADGRAGLLVPDFVSGGALQLSGTARVHWTGDGTDADRRVAFAIDRVVERSSGVVPSMRFVDYSPFNPVGPDAAGS